MKKSLIIFLGVLAISLTLTGCGESEGSVSASANTSVPNSSTADVVKKDTTTSGTAEQNKVTVDTVALLASKTSLEDIFGEVPANPGNK